MTRSQCFRDLCPWPVFFTLLGETGWIEWPGVGSFPLFMLENESTISFNIQVDLVLQIVQYSYMIWPHMFKNVHHIWAALDSL